MPNRDRDVLTPRLRLVPIGPDNADDYRLVHDAADVAAWYDGWRPTREEALAHASAIDVSWQLHGVHKWMAYDRDTGDLIGRGGLSRTPIDDDWGQIYAFLPDESWVREEHDSDRPFRAHAQWLEIGWAVIPELWGHGYASEIGRAGLAYAFDVLGVRAVVSCTVRHNVRSRAVMERIGMQFGGEIYSRGTAEGEDTVRNDAPFSVYIKLRSGSTATSRSS